MNERRLLGKLGEDLAEQILMMEGYQILERNFICKEGEIDLIAQREGELCFIEVKTRRSRAFGEPCEAVNRKKQMRIRKAAGVYLSLGGGWHKYYSFQVIEIGIHQIENAF